MKRTLESKPADLRHDRRDRPRHRDTERKGHRMRHVRSTDGTSIAYEKQAKARR